MKTTNKSRQAAYKARMKKAGFVQVTVWVQKAEKQKLTAFVKNLNYEGE